MNAPLLEVRGLRKIYRSGRWRPRRSFVLEADFAVAGATIIGMMGPNGSGKTTLFELITGGNQPTSGQVLCAGRDIHKVRYGERDRLAVHHHQSYQIRRFRRRWLSLPLARAGSEYPLIHLFDEPEFSAQDGYIGFMLSFFRRLCAEGRLVFICLHPHEPYQVEILREICQRFIFIEDGRLFHAADWTALTEHRAARAYLGESTAPAASQP